MGTFQGAPEVLGRDFRPLAVPPAAQKSGRHGHGCANMSGVWRHVWRTWYRASARPCRRREASCHSASKSDARRRRWRGWAVELDVMRPSWESHWRTERMETVRRAHHRGMGCVHVRRMRGGGHVEWLIVRVRLPLQSYPRWWLWLRVRLHGWHQHAPLGLRHAQHLRMVARKRRKVWV